MIPAPANDASQKDRHDLGMDGGKVTGFKEKGNVGEMHGTGGVHCPGRRGVAQASKPAVAQVSKPAAWRRLARSRPNSLATIGSKAERKSNCAVFTMLRLKMESQECGSAESR